MIARFIHEPPAKRRNVLCEKVSGYLAQDTAQIRIHTNPTRKRGATSKTPRFERRVSEFPR